MKFKIFNYVVIFEIKKRKYKIGYSRRKWTTSETNTLLRLRNEGKSYEEIGKLMNRTASSCYSRIHNIRSKDAK